MAGGTAEHDRISLYLAASLVVRLRGKPCRPCGSNLKRYPDGYITCSPLVPGATVTSDPVVIFEVLSKGTARVDRVEKNRDYRTIASVTHYVMLEQDEVAATVLERSGENWISSLLWSHRYAAPAGCRHRDPPRRTLRRIGSLNSCR